MTEQDIIQELKAEYVKVKSTGRFGTALDYEPSSHATNHIMVPGFGLTTRKNLLKTYNLMRKRQGLPRARQTTLELASLESLQPNSQERFNSLFE